MTGHSPMSPAERLARQARVTWRNATGRWGRARGPSFLVLFINSICNLTCEHCFYWRNLNRRDDLELDEIRALSRQLADLGRLETLNLSGGEPFLREEFAEICRMFVADNGVEQIYVPTNGYFTERTVKSVRGTLEADGLKLFAVELSLDGTEEFHNRFRGSDRSFQKAMETYDALAELQRDDPRLRIHAVSTATADNMDEIGRLTEYLFERCPHMDHHNLALIRGDRKNPSLRGPKLQEYRELADQVAAVWRCREEERYGNAVEPMLQWAKIETARQRRQVVPCRAGVLSAVVYSNGDVSVCETHEPLGNLRQSTFPELWRSREAEQLRSSICAGECYCTNEVFLWPSIVYQPVQLARAAFHTRVSPKLGIGKAAERTPPMPQAGPRPEAEPEGG